MLVDYEGEEDVGKDLAMHIAFAKPQYLSQGRSAAGRGRARARHSGGARQGIGQAAEIAAKMVEGALNKFLNEITLLGQPFVKDDKQTVEKMLAAKKAKVHGYRFLRGRRRHREEGSDFAAEVMAHGGS